MHAAHSTILVPALSDSWGSHLPMALTIPRPLIQLCLKLGLPLDFPVTRVKKIPFKAPRRSELGLGHLQPAKRPWFTEEQIHHLPAQAHTLEVALSLCWRSPSLAFSLCPPSWGGKMTCRSTGGEEDRNDTSTNDSNGCPVLELPTRSAIPGCNSSLRKESGAQPE